MSRKLVRWQWLILVSSLFAFAPALVPVTTVHAQATSEAVVPTCQDPRLTIQPPVSAVWYQAIAQVCGELATMGDLDPSARIHVVGDGEGLLLELTLSDGRGALRRVRAPDALRLTIEALLTMPPQKPTETAVEQPNPVVAAHDNEKPPGLTTHEPADTHERNALLELGVGASARFAGSPSYAFIGLSAYFAVPVGNWLFGLTVRWDALQLIEKQGYKDFEFDQVGVGFMLGHRLWRSRMVCLDAGGGALVVVESQSTQRPVSGEDSDSATDVKLGGLLRAQFGKGDTRFLAILDAEFSPTRLRRSIRIDSDLPRLPGYSVALTLGASWHVH